MIIVCISDTHGQHMAKRLKIPHGDMLIYCGDFTASRGLIELANFAQWFNSLPHKYKIFVPGNHDWVFAPPGDVGIKAFKYDCPNLIYLDNELVEIENIKIYGTPVQPEFMNWAFNFTPEKRKLHYSHIPDNIDILITHCPPKNILDWCPFGKNAGCEILRDEVLGRIKPKYHIFGHIHEGYGIKKECGITFINCSLMTGDYRLKNDPIVFEYKIKVD